MRRFSFIILFVLSVLALGAQNRDSLIYDSDGDITIRSSEKINDFLKDDDFQYDKKNIKRPVTFAERLKRWLNELFNFFERGGKPVSYTFYAILIGILIFVIVKLTGLNYQTLFVKKKKLKTPEIEVFDEDIHNIDFDSIISKAVQNKNYRTAVRYLYIKFLKSLADAEFIEWEINKTNKDYRKEMKNTEYFSIFKDLTYVYEYVWYGEFLINDYQFEKFYIGFQNVYKNL